MKKDRKRIDEVMKLIKNTREWIALHLEVDSTILDNAVEGLAKAIVASDKERWKEERLDIWKQAYEQYKFDAEIEAMRKYDEKLKPLRDIWGRYKNNPMIPFVLGQAIKKTLKGD